MNGFEQKMMLSGVCDERGAAVCATAEKLPNGAYGMCLLGVKGNVLQIYDTNMKSEVGTHLYDIPLCETEGFQRVSGLFGELIKGYSFRFTYEGFKYVFKNCSAKKNVVDIIEAECKK